MKRHPHFGVVQRFFAFLSQYEMLGSDLAVAFSGGPDSTALAICCAEAVRAGKLGRTVAIHVDHGVRLESKDDAKAAEAIAKSLSIPFRSLRLNLESTASEALMRDARYEALVSISKQESIPNLATAHHRRDQAETLLLHLVRGSGTRGLAGLDEFNTFATAAGSIRLYRPFLGEAPGDLAALIEASGQNPVQDPTNLQIDKTRNFLRHEVLPSLAKVNPGVESHLANFAQIIGSENEVLDDVAHDAALDVLDNAGLDSVALKELHVSIQRRVIRKWISEQTDCELSFDRCEAIRHAAIAGTGGVAIELGGGWSAHQRERRFTLHQSSHSDGELQG